ncbi:hypothetical protein [Actinoplanes couchii]|uniref:Excalibur calcium-binding domain-containing protein n=1 Tax=Actinoplanes couchii TaxID=403638 RepID=A0ABQ3X8P3_9ACTN|nr:hypothetical protein [Actinoplanes couchii]MDR6320107.1 hypothetical protein [Actinoplanes couchii]GID54878.1 hypothetical protein Aco03nite_032820 [Actinoplanes couchii]
MTADRQAKRETQRIETTMKNVAVVLATVLAVVVAASVGAIAYLMGSRDGRATTPTAGPAPVIAVTEEPIRAVPVTTPSSPAPRPSTSVKTVYVTPAKKQPERVTLGSLGSKPCATLFARGVTYTRMWDYYQEFGLPGSMDVDHDGYPCETVYGDVN